nr:hypothetical protein [Nocardioides convexus]
MLTAPGAEPATLETLAGETRREQRAAGRGAPGERARRARRRRPDRREHRRPAGLGAASCW